MKSPILSLFPSAGLRLAILATAAATLSSCVTTSTVQSRINARPELYTALPASQRTTVERGQIKEGFSKDAVYLAWGAPDRVLESGSGGKRTETWLYESYQPVYTEHVGIGHGYGYGGYGGLGRRRGYCDPYGGLSDFSYSTEVHYQPYLARKVEFNGDKVKSWQRMR